MKASNKSSPNLYCKIYDFPILTYASLWQYIQYDWWWNFFFIIIIFKIYILLFFFFFGV